MTWAYLKATLARLWVEHCELNRANYRDFIKPHLPTRYVIHDDVEAEWGLTKQQARALLRMAEKGKRKSGGDND